MTQAEIDAAIAECDTQILGITEQSATKNQELQAAEQVAEPYNQTIVAAELALQQARDNAQPFNDAVTAIRQALSDLNLGMGILQNRRAELLAMTPIEPPTPIFPNAPEGLELVNPTVARWLPVITEGCEASVYVIERISQEGAVEHVQADVVRPQGEAHYIASNLSANYDSRIHSLRVYAAPYQVNGTTSETGAATVMGPQPN